MGILLNSIAELRNHAPTAGASILVLGYYSPNDGGGGVFYADTADLSSPDDGGMTIQPTVGSGRWKRLWSGAISIRYFGALSEGEPEVNALTPTRNGGDPTSHKLRSYDGLFLPHRCWFLTNNLDSAGESFAIRVPVYRPYARQLFRR